MSDPLGFIGNSSGIHGLGLNRTGAERSGCTPGESFKDLLSKQISEVNSLQQDAERAIEDLMTQQRSDVEGVITATQKADMAFRMLLQVRNKMIDAYDELRQMRV